MSTTVRSSLLTIALVVVAAGHAAAQQPNGTWRQLSVSGYAPSARSGHTMVYDSVNGRMILYGGESAVGDTILGDAWALSLGCNPQWTRLSNSGPQKYAHVAAYFPNPSPRMLVYGGFGVGQSFAKDTWQLSLGSSAAWVFEDSVGALCPRVYASATADPVNNWMLVFGGQASPYFFSMYDAWAMGSAYTWNHLSGDTDCRSSSNTGAPDRRWGQAQVYDALNYRSVLFGGIYEDDNTSANAWATNDGGTTWYKILDAGFVRARHTGVYDPDQQRMLIFGGTDEVVSYNDLHAMSLTLHSEAVTTLTPAGTPPPPSAGAAAAWDPSGHRMFVFGGDGGSAGLWTLQFDNTPPAAISDLGSSLICNVAVQLQWTAPGDDGSTGTACRYDVRYSLSPITDANFSSASQVANPPTPQPAGSYTQCVVNGLHACQTYYFAVKTTDESGNVSPISNVFSVQTLCSSKYTCGAGAGPALREGSVPGRTTLSPPWPNPARGGVNVRYTVSRDGEGQPFEVSIFDIAGRRVRLLDSGTASAGEFDRTWDLRGDNGSMSRRGLYFVRLRVGETHLSHALMVNQ